MRYILFFHIFSVLSVMAAAGAVPDTCPSVAGPVDSTSVHAGSDSLVRQADRYMLDYEFLKALSLYRQALYTERDSVKRIALENKKLQGENGASMMEYVYSPTVVARHRFSTKDFFLYYPMKDKSWREVPNVLDSLSGHPFAEAVYVPDDSDEIYFSAPDGDGVRNIWHTVDRDTLWSLPALLNEQVTSSGDEVYPLLSQDGRDLTEDFLRGARLAMETARRHGCTAAILKRRSPSCGVGQIYDGTFSRTLCPGDGLWARMLREAGFALYTEEHLPEDI